MKKYIIITILSLVLVSFTTNIKKVSDTRKLTNNAFCVGESLKYRIHYGIINAGTVSMNVSKNVTINGKNTFNLKIEGQTLKSFEWAYKVRDKFESWIDLEMYAPLRYSKTIRENKYFDEDLVIFNHEQNWLKNTKGSLLIPKYTQDISSAIYYLRLLNYNNLSIGSKYSIDVYFDNKLYNLDIKYIGKEVINTDIGKLRCIKLKPELIVDRVFKNKDAMTVWVSDDENKIPIRIQTDISVGSLKVDITKTENLKNPISCVVKK
jgi:hypothetical protein